MTNTRPKEQYRNRKTNRILEFNGVKKTLAEWSEIYKLSSHIIAKRIGRGWGVGEALKTPILPIRCIATYKLSPKDKTRFWNKVEKTAYCWNWTGRISTTGYGLFAINSVGKTASRISYIITHGSIPKNMFVLHKCDNPICVNPAHLKAGTHRDNMDDLIRSGRRKKKNINFTAN